MSGSRSQEEDWDEMATGENVVDALTTEGDINHRVVESLGGSAQSSSLWTSCGGGLAVSCPIRMDASAFRDERDTQAPSGSGGGKSKCRALDMGSVERNGDGGSRKFSIRMDSAFRAVDKQAPSRSGEGHSNCRAVAIDISGLERNGEGGYRRFGKNVESAVSSVWSGREDQGQAQSSDHSGLQGGCARRFPSYQWDLNEPAPGGDAARIGSHPVSEQGPARDVRLAAEEHVPDRYDPGGRPPIFLGADRLILPVGRAADGEVRYDSRISLHGLVEGMDMRAIPEISEAESHDLLQVGGAAEVEGGEVEIERPTLCQNGLRSLVRCSEQLHHKRAKFLSLPIRRHPLSAPSRGSSPASSSSSLPGSPSGCDRGNLPAPSAPLHPPSEGDEQEPMESDDAGGEDGDDGERWITIAEMDDGEVRMDLTDDLLHKVFSFLDDTALCQAAMVCKQWRVASAHEDFWKILNFEERHVSHKQVGLLCVRYPKATTLNLRGAPCVDEVLVREAMRSLRNLEVLTLGRGLLSDAFFYALAIECSSLQSLSISDAMLGNGGAQEIQLRHESLRRLQIHKCRVLRIAIRCPQLDWLSLKRTGTASAMLHCPRLVTLDVSACHKLSDAGVRAAATACPLLASLDMSACAYVSDETLREISMACTNLRTLDASYCPNISLEGVRMPMLIELKLQGCEGIISSSMAALSTCAMLEDLAMDFCWLLTAVSLDLPRLRQISLTNNRKFVELTLRSPALTKLNLANCPILSRVDITSSSLQSLVLRQQNGLSSMALQCNWLREVDLSECEALTDAVCDVFSDGGGCPKLRSLILDSCEGLNDVKLASSSLQCLSLVGCRKISSLNLACPVLQQLHLDGCDHLTEASFAPVGLQSLNLGICPHLKRLTVEASQMTTLDLRGCGVLKKAAICCPSLMSLDASYCGKLGDACLDQTTAACPSIQSLVLASCPSVGPVGLLTLKRLRDLTMLDLSYTFLTDLSPIFESCPGLKVLRLSACKYLGDTALDALHGGKVLPELRELDLSYGSLGNTAIEGVMALCPHLCHVSLNGCAHVTDLLWARLSSPPVVTAASPEISSTEDIGMEDAAVSDDINDGPGTTVGQLMDVATARDDCHSHGPSSFSDGMIVHAKEGDLPDLNSAVPGFAGLAMPDAVSSSVGSETIPGTPLTPLEVMESKLAMDAELGPVRALQNLSCVGCPHIKKVVIPRFAACLHLSSLNLSLSVNIQEVQLSCSNLTALNLSNCAGLVVLELDCPRLISLSLQACGIEAEMLELAVQGCNLLETLDVRNCARVSSAALSRMRLVCPGLKRLYCTTSTEGGRI